MYEAVQCVPTILHTGLASKLMQRDKCGSIEQFRKANEKDIMKKNI